MPKQPTYLPFEETADEHSQRQRLSDRRHTILLLLTIADDAVDLLFLVEELDLVDELDEIAGTSVERQRLISVARAELDERLPRQID